MIVSLRGRVIGSGRDHVVLEVNGIGYQVFTPDPHLMPLSSEVYLHTVMIVRDDGLSLYGFPDSIGSELFRNLLRVGGIGPRLALAILATMRTDSLRQAIQGERADPAHTCAWRGTQDRGKNRAGTPGQAGGQNGNITWGCLV